MARNYKERQAYAYLRGITNKVSPQLLKKWHRHNFDIGLFRASKKRKTEKIINRETISELNEL